MIPADGTFDGTFSFQPHFSDARGFRMHGAIFPDVVIAHVRAAFPQAAVVELEHAGHFCQEDEPETVVALIEQFVQLT